MHPLGHNPVLRRNRVVVVIGGKFGAQPIGGFAGPTGAYRVRQDEVVLRGVQRLTRPE
jgi:hypothetical protein